MEAGRVVKTFTSKKGHEVVIRYPRWEDLDDLTTYINELSQEDTFIEFSKEAVTKESEARYLSSNFCAIEKGDMIQLFLFVDRKFAGNCAVTRGIRRRAHVGEIGIAVSKNFREEGIGTVFLETLIEEIKKMKGITVLTLTCYENNPRALHVYEKLGFQKVGVVPGAIAFHGEFVGEVMMYKTL